MLTRITAFSKRTLIRIMLFLDGIRYSFKLRMLTRSRIYGIQRPFAVIDQLASPKLETVTEYFGQINDLEAAHRFGTKNIKEYSYWAWRACGIACVASILATFSKPDKTLYGLTKEARKNNGYLLSDKAGNTDIGWKHQSLAGLLEKRGFRTQLSGILSAEGILFNILRGSIVIASVKSRLSKKGRHMVLVTGFTWNGSNTMLKLIDPFLLDGKGGSKEVAFGEFKRYYMGRGIIVWPKS